MDNNSNTQTQLNALRTLQQSYDALATASSNGATSVEVENAKQAILDAIGAIDIDTSDLAKQGSDSAVTLTEVSEKIGVPASGQPSDLFAAIAAGGSVGDDAHNLAQFFGLPQALPEYTYATDQEVIDIVDDVYNAYFPNN